MGQPQNERMQRSLVERLKSWSDHSADTDLAGVLEEARREILLLRLRLEVSRSQHGAAND